MQLLVYDFSCVLYVVLVTLVSDYTMRLSMLVLIRFLSSNLWTLQCCWYIWGSSYSCLTQRQEKNVRGWCREYINNKSVFEFSENLNTITKHSFYHKK